MVAFILNDYGEGVDVTNFGLWIFDVDIYSELSQDVIKNSTILSLF